MANMKRTARGNMVDLDELKKNKQNIRAVSNVNITAGGDYLDDKGNVIKSRDQMIADYKKANKNNGVQQVSLKQKNQEEFSNMLKTTTFKTAEEAVDEVKNRKRKLVKDDENGSPE